MRSLRGFEELGQETSPARAQYFGKTKLSIYSSRRVLTVLLSAGDGITSLLCRNGYQRFPTAFMFSEGRIFSPLAAMERTAEPFISKEI
jgi:hypothetical protein